MLADGHAIYTPGLSERRNGVSRFLKLDDGGSVRGQAAAGFASGAYRSQDAFGNTVSQAGTVSGPFSFEADAQYQTDGDSGLTLVGNRYYDAVVGRFLQPDPSGQEDNEYAYAANNPLSFNDPEGLHNGANKKKNAARAARAKRVKNNYRKYEHIDKTDCGRFVQHVVGFNDLAYPKVRVTLQRAYVKSHPKTWTYGSTENPEDLQPGDILYRGNHHTAILVSVVYDEKRGWRVNTVEASLHTKNSPGHTPDERNDSAHYYTNYARLNENEDDGG